VNASFRHHLTLASALALCGACDDAPPPPKELLVIDGLTIELAEVEPMMKFLDSYLPEAGRKAKVQRILDEHVLPLHLARRAFAKERVALLEKARALCQVATNVDELEQHSKAMSETMRRMVSRNQPKLPVAQFLFDPLLTRSVSPPIEMPHGWVVAAAYSLAQEPLAIDDHVDSLQVTFSTHSAADWRIWLEKEQKRVGDKVTFVHPDYREALPPWVTPPKLP